MHMCLSLPGHTQFGRGLSFVSNGNGALSVREMCMKCVLSNKKAYQKGEYNLYKQTVPTCSPLICMIEYIHIKEGPHVVALNLYDRVYSYKRRSPRGGLELV